MRAGFGMTSGGIAGAATAARRGGTGPPTTDVSAVSAAGDREIALPEWENEMLYKKTRHKPPVDAKEYPLFSMYYDSKIANKALSHLTFTEIHRMFEPTGYTPRIHFVQRISQAKGRQRLNSLGITTGEDLAAAFGKARRTGTIEVDELGRQEERWSIESGMAMIVVNPQTKQLVTVTYR